MNFAQSLDAEPRHAPLTEILAALGEEFSALGQFTETFQTSLSPALLRVANDPDCHRNVQTLDLLAQRLTALSLYVLTIGREVPEDVRINPQTALRSPTSPIGCAARRCPRSRKSNPASSNCSERIEESLP